MTHRTITCALNALLERRNKLMRPGIYRHSALAKAEVEEIHKAIAELELEADRIDNE